MIHNVKIATQTYNHSTKTKWQGLTYVQTLTFEVAKENLSFK